MQDSFSASDHETDLRHPLPRLRGRLLVPPEATRQVLLFGGNVVFVSMMVGWLLGDLFRPQWS